MTVTGQDGAAPDAVLRPNRDLRAGPRVPAQPAPDPPAKADGTRGKPGTSGQKAPAKREKAAAKTRPPRRRRRLRPISPLTLRILAVNVLALGTLMGGLLYLGTYQQWLIGKELESLTTEARIFAGALGEGAIEPSFDEFNEPSSDLSYELARQMVRRLVETTDTRTRLFAPSGELVADSRVLGGPKSMVQIEELPPLRDGNPLSELGIRLYDYAVNAVPEREHLPAYPMESDMRADAFPDVQKALNGEIGNNVWRVARVDGRTDMLLTVAVPIQRYKKVLGAVYISRTGSEIDRAVREFRMDILRLFGGTLGVTVLLSLYLAGTIARPIRRLAEAADAVRTGHGRQATIPDFSRRRDEVGDLSVSLREMTAAIWNRMDAIERFAADVAHEIKNPLTSMRSAVETVQLVKTDEQRQRLLAIIHHDVQRLDRLISDISNASRLDAELSRANTEPVDVGQVLTMLADIHNVPLEHNAALGASTGQEGEAADAAPVRVQVDLPAGANLVVPGLEGRLTQVFQNLLSNALSFSPPGGTVTLRARAFADRVEATVEDQGPGIPEGKLAAIFDRFYSERPKSEAFGKHSGLGLSISKQIIDALQGRIFADNRKGPDGGIQGAVFTVVLPRG
ncbi:stimulus-sensing domain-containing protein [Oleisolibacter albus]|uniref:stimulus-sensing domain-containing protein n=1 Tax=Oleisolibacter albus TaxID=2171757 RepID=UPI000DF493DE|nr:stimulus-sensing domain-containing protein [Oleisolibacter albus]